MLHTRRPIDSPLRAAHANLIVWNDLLNRVFFGLDGFVCSFKVLILSFHGFLSLGGLLLGCLHRLVVIFSNMGEYVIESIKAGKLKGPHELEYGLFLVLCFYH